MSKRNSRITRTVAGALAVTALAAPAASALPAEQIQAKPGTDESAGYQAPRPTVTSTIDDGFDMGSAAIGAGSASVLLLLTAAGASAVSHRHQRVDVAR